MLPSTHALSKVYQGGGVDAATESRPRAPGQRREITLTDLQREHLANVLRHVEAEIANNVDLIVTTIDDHCRYPLLHRAPDGTLRLEAITDLAGAEAYYRDMRTGVDITSSHHIRRITTDWYVFNHSAAAMRHVGDVDGMPPTGREYAYESAVLFPVSAHAIVGEIPWNRYSFPEMVRGIKQPALTDAERVQVELRNLAAHEAYCNAMISGEVADPGAYLAPRFVSATRNYFSPGAPGLTTAEGEAGFRRQVQTLHEAVHVVDAVVVNRIVTSWYVFAELAWRLRARSDAVAIDGEFDVKTAAIFPLDDGGRMLAELGYGTDMPLLEGREPLMSAPAAAAEALVAR